MAEAPRRRGQKRGGSLFKGGEEEERGKRGVASRINLEGGEDAKNGSGNVLERKKSNLGKGGPSSYGKGSATK